MVIPLIKEVKNLLSFAKSSFKSCKGFRHAQGYISGLISLGKKTVKKISSALVGNNNSSSMNRVLSEATFDKEKLENRYFKKIKYLFKNSKVTLVFDDTLVERNGKKIEGTKYHYDHSQDKDIKGHQFFTAMLHTPILELPIFPELYSTETDSKIDIAINLIDRLKESAIKINNVLFDSWYSDERIINKCKKESLISAKKN